MKKNVGHIRAIREAVGPDVAIAQTPIWDGMSITPWI